MPQFYKWFQSTDRAAVERCKALIDQVHGSEVAAVSTAAHLDPQQHGTPVGAGPDAPPGNPGIQLIQGIQDEVRGGTAPNISAEERTELIAFYDASIPLDQKWFIDPNDDF